MKVIIDVHDTTISEQRGIPQYIVNLTRHLIVRKRYKYGLTYFDWNHAKGNRELVNRHFQDLNPVYYECSSMKRSFMNAYNAYAQQSFDESIGTKADVFHFPSSAFIPDKISGAMVTTVLDTIPLRKDLDSIIPCYNIGMYRIKKMQPVIITISKAERKEICSLEVVPEKNVFAIPLGVDLCHYNKNNGDVAAVKAKFGLTRAYFIILGSIGELRKNTARILDAFYRLPEQKDMNLVFVGKFDKTFVQRSFGNLKIKENVIITDYVNEEEKIALLSGSTALLFPSLYEGFGLPIIEAQACGVPVITSNLSCMPEVAGDSALLVDPYQVDSITLGMEDMINDAAFRNELISKGYENIKRFSWDKSAEETEKVYQYAYELNN